MKYNIVFTDDALLDTDRVYNEVFKACLDNKTTKDYLNELLEKVELISDFPESGTSLYIGKLLTDYRYIIYKSYIAFYHFDNGTIFVDRILYGKSDYLSTLGIK